MAFLRRLGVLGGGPSAASDGAPVREAAAGLPTVEGEVPPSNGREPGATASASGSSSRGNGESSGPDPVQSPLGKALAAALSPILESDGIFPDNTPDDGERSRRRSEAQVEEGDRIDAALTAFVRVLRAGAQISTGSEGSLVRIPRKGIHWRNAVSLPLLLEAADSAHCAIPVGRDAPGKPGKHPRPDLPPKKRYLLPDDERTKALLTVPGISFGAARVFVDSLRARVLLFSRRLSLRTESLLLETHADNSHETTVHSPAHDPLLQTLDVLSRCSHTSNLTSLIRCGLVEVLVQCIRVAASSVIAAVDAAAVVSAGSASTSASVRLDRSARLVGVLDEILEYFSALMALLCTCVESRDSSRTPSSSLSRAMESAARLFVDMFDVLSPIEQFLSALLQIRGSLPAEQGPKLWCSAMFLGLHALSCLCGATRGEPAQAYIDNRDTLCRRSSLVEIVHSLVPPKLDSSQSTIAFPCELRRCVLALELSGVLIRHVCRFDTIPFADALPPELLNGISDALEWAASQPPIVEVAQYDPAGHHRGPRSIVSYLFDGLVVMSKSDPGSKSKLHAGTTSLLLDRVQSLFDSGANIQSPVPQFEYFRLCSRLILLDTDTALSALTRDNDPQSPIWKMLFSPLFFGGPEGSSVLYRREALPAATCSFILSEFSLQLGRSNRPECAAILETVKTATTAVSEGCSSRNLQAVSHLAGLMLNIERKRGLFQAEQQGHEVNGNIVSLLSLLDGSTESLAELGSVSIPPHEMSLQEEMLRTRSALVDVIDQIVSENIICSASVLSPVLIQLLLRVLAEDDAASGLAGDDNDPSSSQAQMSPLKQRVLQVCVRMLRSDPLLPVDLATDPNVDSEGRPDMLLNACCQYLLVLTRSPPPSLPLLLGMLAGIRVVLTRHLDGTGGFDPIRQELLRKAGAIEKLTACLAQFPVALDDIQKQRRPGMPPPIMPSQVDAVALTCEVLPALTAILAGNGANKEHFETFIGYDTLQHALEHVCQRNLSLIVLQLLLDMLVDGEFDATSALTASSAAEQDGVGMTILIRNPNVVVLLLHLMPCFSFSDQEFLLDTLNKLLAESTLNKSLSCNSQVGFELLRVLERQFRNGVASEATNEFRLSEKLVGLLQLVGAHSMPVRELKQLIGMLRAPWPREAPLLLRALSDMATKKSSTIFSGTFKPSAFLNFDGADSRLNLPNRFSAWPCGQGYSLGLWLRLEALDCRVGAPVRAKKRVHTMQERAGASSARRPLRRAESEAGLTQALLSCLDDAETRGIIVSITPARQVCVTYLVPESDPSERWTEALASFSLPTGRWHHVVLAHEPRGRLGGSAVLKLYVDGQLEARTNARLPGGSQLTGLDSKTIGWCRAEGFQPFSGQIASVCVFDSALSSTQVTSLTHLGPNYSGSFVAGSASGSGTAEQPEAEGASKIDSSLKSARLDRSCVLHLHCRGCQGSLVVDSAPQQQLQRYAQWAGTDRGDLEESKQPSYHNGVLEHIIFSSTRDIRDSIHCIGGMQALFPLVAQLAVSEAGMLSDESVQERAQMLTLVFALLRDMLSDSHTNQRSMLQSNGIVTVSFLLLRVPPALLSESLVDVVEELAHHITISFVQGDVLRHFFLDFRIWCYASYSVQRHVLQCVLRLMTGAREFFRAEFGLFGFFDILRNFYGPGEIGAVRPTANANELGRVVTSEELVQLRLQVYECIGALIGTSTDSVESAPQTSKRLSSEDANAIMQFLMSDIESALIEECLTFVLSHPFVLESLLELGGVDVWLPLLRCEDESVRISAIQVFARSIERLYRTEGPALELAQTPAPTLSEADTVVPLRDLDFEPLLRALMMYPCTSETIQTLFGVMLSDITAGSGSGPRRKRQEEPSTFNFPGVLPIVLRLLVGAPLELQLACVREISRLLAARPPSNDAQGEHDSPAQFVGEEAARNNRLAVMRYPGWQNLFYSLIADDKSRAESPDASLTRACVDVISVVIAEACCGDKQGFRVLEESMYLLHVFGQRGVLSAEDLSRNLLHAVLARLADFPKRLAAQHAKSGDLEPSSRKASGLGGLFRRSLRVRTDDSTPWTPSKDVLDNFFNVVTIAKEFVSGAWDLTGPAMFSHDTAHVDDWGDMKRIIGAPHIGDEDGRWHDSRLASQLLTAVDSDHWNMTQMNFPSGVASRPLHPGGMIRLRVKLCLQIIGVCVLSGRNIAGVAQAIRTLRLLLLLREDDNAEPLAHSTDAGAMDERFRLTLHALQQLVLFGEGAADGGVESSELPSVLSLLKALLCAARPWVGVQIAKGERDAQAHVPPEAQKEFVGWLNGLCRLEKIELALLSADTPRWEALSGFLISQTRSLHEQDDDFQANVASRIEWEANSCEGAAERAEVRAIEREKELEASATRQRQMLCDADERRLSAAAETAEELALQLAREWKLLLRAVKNERGPWGVRYSAGQASEATADHFHWKLDKTENASRMRLKLKRNYNFDPHANAALNDDTTGQESTEAIVDHNSDEEMTYDANDWLVTGTANSLSSAPATPAREMSRQATVRALSRSALGSRTEIEAVDVEDKVLLTCDAEIVTPTGAQRGVLTVTASQLHFHAKLWDGQRTNVKNRSSRARQQQDFGYSLDDEAGALGRKLDYFWKVADIKEMHGRRFLLRPSALELFLADGTNFFINFSSESMRNKFHKRIETLEPPLLAFSDCRVPSQILKRAKLTERWQHRDISNFDYLMHLNTIAGRTFNDLTQYPVFPWILSAAAYDLDADTLDLDDPAMFRDLSKPVGALNPERLTQFVERFESWEDPTGVIPAFHYGSHYSSALTVLWYLCRLEPFTTLYLEMQGGHFDHADRMFFGISNAFFNNTHGSADVKELVPEFFCLPEMFTKPAGVEFGVRQDGTHLGDVELPKWAHGSAHEFVRVHRQALESEFVSAHLHEWIDLIFGYKQQGRNAVEAHNVFYYLTYEGSVDLDAIKDVKDKKATIAQIRHFGQTPSQLIRDKPHQSRDKLGVFPTYKSTLFESGKVSAEFVQVAGRGLTAADSESESPPSIAETTLCFVAAASLKSGGASALGPTERIVTVDAFRVPALHRWVSGSVGKADGGTTRPWTFDLDPMIRTRPRSPVATATKPGCFATSRDGRVVYACGHASKDHAFHVLAADTGRVVQVVSRHKDVVTALALDGTVLVSGSRDTTLMVWQIQSNTGFRVGDGSAAPLPRLVLYGHDDEVTSVSVSQNLDLVFSGSSDGSAIVHTARQGKYVRSIFHKERLPIDMVAIAPDSTLLVYCGADLSLRSYTVNAHPLQRVELNERLNHFSITDDSRFVVAGGDRGVVVVRRLLELSPVLKFSANSGIACTAFTKDGKYLLVALQDGKLLIVN
jgi:Beige/BEACH domain/Neurobeachin beta propeller domain/Neurobeachin/BDCP, DUF4704 alpha solenoid region/PH domain associated with Beige/BEACH/Neurobeachin alpha solenoid region/Domain of unknown function (DUF4800)/Concanavalin A-like lectin/glucanases superfamily